MATLTTTLSFSALTAAGAAWVPSTSASPEFGSPRTAWVYQDPISPPYLYSISVQAIAIPAGATVTAVTFNYDITADRSFSSVDDELFLGRYPLVYLDFLQDTDASFGAAFGGMTAGTLSFDFSDPGITAYSDSVALSTALIRPGHTDVARYGFDTSATPGTFPIPSGTQDEQARVYGSISLVIDYTVDDMTIDLGTVNSCGDGGGDCPTCPPYVPVTTPPTPPSGITNTGLTIRTPPLIAMNLLAARNTPDIRVSANLRVSSGLRVVS